jgi:hypothetical protein
MEFGGSTHTRCESLRVLLFFGAGPFSEPGPIGFQKRVCKLPEELRISTPAVEI